MTAYTLLVIVHVLLFAYWLGADWGVYVNSRYVADSRLSLDERRRFLEAAFRIDLMPRMAFTLLLPVGLQLASYYGNWPPLGRFMLAVWAGALAWFAINLLGYLHRGTPRGERLRNVDQAVRVVLAPILIAVGLWSAATGQLLAPAFIAWKVTVFGCMIVVGLLLRSIMRHWVTGFRRLAQEGPTPDVNAIFERSLARAKWIAYGMWSLSAVMAILGVLRPA
jgi:hypothetical protein